MKNLDAENIVNQIMQLNSIGCAIVPGSTMEFKKCFAVFYQSKQYIETGEFNQMLVGHGHVLVDKESGSIYSTGSAYSVERYVEAFEESGDPFAEKSESLLVVQCSNKNNAPDVIKYLHAKLIIGLAKSKEYVDSIIGGKTIELICKDPIVANEVSEYLNNRGFLTKQLWKSAKSGKD